MDRQKNPVLVGNGIDASTQGMIGVTSLGWQSATLPMGGLGGCHDWDRGRLRT